MIKKCVLFLAAAVGVFILAPSAANAFHGKLVQCTAAPGITGVATVSPGFNCLNAVRKIGVTTSIKKLTNFTCTEANAQDPGAPWTTWQTVKWDKTGPQTITQADVALKAITYGSCNFTAPLGDPAAGANGAGTITFYNAGLKVASSSYVGQVVGDAATFSAKTVGVITKGMGIGATLILKSGLDGADPNTGAAIACTAGAICPPGPDPYSAKGQGSCAGKATDPSCCDLGCIGAGNPATCCTGAGTGTCINNSGCTGVGAPEACCTGPGKGTCKFSVGGLGACLDGKTLGLTTTGGNSSILIQIPSNADCINKGDPLPCCSGPAAGSC